MNKYQTRRRGEHNTRRHSRRIAINAALARGLFSFPKRLRAYDRFGVWT